MSARAWAKAFAFIVVAWGALLGAVFGASVGIATHTMAAKLSVNALHLQRQAGSTSATRSAGREQARISAQPQLAAERHEMAGYDSSGDVSPPGFASETAQTRAVAPTSVTAEPRLKPRYHAPQSRAPPALA